MQGGCTLNVPSNPKHSIILTNLQWLEHCEVEELYRRRVTCMQGPEWKGCLHVFHPLSKHVVENLLRIVRRCYFGNCAQNCLLICHHSKLNTPTKTKLYVSHFPTCIGLICTERSKHSTHSLNSRLWRWSRPLERWARALRCLESSQALS